MSQYDGSVKFDTKIDTSNMQSALAGLKATAAAAFAAIGAAGTVAIKKCLDAGMSFSSIMSQVEALSGATEKQMEALTAKAKEMGASTVFSATQAGEAMTFMAQAGWQTEDMLSGLEGIMYLAASAGEDLASVSNIVTDSLTAFGLAASDSAHFADVLAVASAASNTDVAMMGATFKYAAPLAGALGYSIEDVAVATGLMANAGIKGEQAGTSLRMIFTQLSADSGEAANAMKELGISVENSDGSMKPLGTTITELREKFSHLTAAEQTALASQIAGTNAMSGLLAIVNASEADFENLTKAVKAADGAAKDMSETMVDNLKGDLVLMESALEGVEVAVYDSLEEPFRAAAQGATNALAELERSISGGELQPKVKKLGNSLADFAEAFVDLATDAIPVFIDVLSGLLENLDLLSATIIGIVQAKALHTAMTTYQSLMTMSTARVVEYTEALAFEQSTEARGITVSQMVLSQMTLKDLAVGVLTGKITLATAAQNLWNAAMNSNPIGLLVMALGVLIPLVGTAFKRAVDNANASTKAFNESMKQINDTYDRAIESANEHIESAEVEAAKLDALTKKVFELDEELAESNKDLETNADETENNKKKKAELLAAVNDLKEQVPGLAVEIDEETGRIKTEREEVLKLVGAYKQLIIAKANATAISDELNAATTKRRQLQKQFETLTSGFFPESDEGYLKMVEAGIFSEEDAATKNYNDNIAALLVGTKKDKELANQIMETKRLLQEATDEVDTLADEYVAALGETGKLDGNTTGNSGNAGNNTETDAERVLRNLKHFYEMGEISAKDYYDALERYRDEYTEKDSEAWQELSVEIKKGRDRLAEEEQEERTRQREEELEELERQKDRGLISEEEYYDELGELRDKYFEEGSKEWQEYTDKIIDHEKEVISETISDIARFTDSTLGEVQAKIDSMREKVASYGSLMTEDENGNKKLTDPRDTLDTLLEYNYALSEIEKRMGLFGFDEKTTDSFFSIMEGMSVEEARDFGMLLLEKDDGDFRQYIERYAEQLRLSERFTESIYGDDYEKAVDEATDYMKKAFEDLGIEIPEDFFTTGSDSAKKFGEAFVSEMGRQMVSIQNSIAAFNSQLSIGFGNAIGGLFGMSGSEWATVANNYNTTNFNIYNPGGNITEGLQASTVKAEEERQRNG